MNQAKEPTPAAKPKTSEPVQEVTLANVDNLSAIVGDYLV